MLLFYESTYIFMRLSLHAQRKKNKSEKAQSNKLSAFNYFLRLPRQSRMFPDRETYGSESKNIRFTQRKHTIDKFVSYITSLHFMFTNAFYTKSTARMPNPTATKVEISPGIINEWLSTYFPIRVVPVVSKLMAATTVG